MNCPKCNKEVSPEWNVCPYCGYKPTKCRNSNCNSGWLPQDAKFCPICGTPLDGHTSTEPASKYDTNSASQFAGSTANNATRSNINSQPLEEESYVVNYFRGISYVTGRLRMEEERAVFKAKFMLIGDGSEIIIPVADIAGYKGGPLTFLTIYMRNGNHHKLTVYDRDGIVNALEKRRKQYYQKRGMSVPSLMLP